LDLPAIRVTRDGECSHLEPGKRVRARRAIPRLNDRYVPQTRRQTVNCLRKLRALKHSLRSEQINAQHIKHNRTETQHIKPNRTETQHIRPKHIKSKPDRNAAHQAKAHQIKTGSQCSTSGQSTSNQTRTKSNRTESNYARPKVACRMRCWTEP